MWELIQNAGDAAQGEEVEIFIHLKRDGEGWRLEFSHSGRPFNVLTLTSLVNQVSGKERGPREEGRESTGRFGTGFMTTHCLLYTSLAESEPGCRVVLSLSTTEETSGELCTGYMVENGLTGDFAVCGEPTNLAVSVMSKGVFRVKARLHGRAAHSSRPWQGENALLKAYELYRGIEKLPFVTRKNRYFDGASVNLSMVRGGVVMNQVPDYAEMVVDIRYLPGEMCIRDRPRTSWSTTWTRPKNIWRPGAEIPLP